MKFKRYDRVTLKLDSSRQVYVIVGMRHNFKGQEPIYEIKTYPTQYLYDDVWESDLLLVEEPNDIIKNIL